MSLLAQGSLPLSTPLPALSPAQSELPVWDSPQTLRAHLSASVFCPSAVGHQLSSRADSFLREIRPCLFCSRQLLFPSLLPSGFQRSPLALPSNSQTHLLLTHPCNIPLQSGCLCTLFQIHWGFASLFPLPGPFSSIPMPQFLAQYHLPRKPCSDDDSINCHSSPLLLPPLFHPTTSL